MCRLYGFRASEPTKVECTLVHAQNALMVQSEADLSGKSHANGWGLATFENGAMHIERQAWAAYHGEHFRRAAARIYSQQVLAHVRRATVGKPTLANTHPFVDGGWALIHNGTIPHFDQVRPLLLDRLPEHRRAAVGGDTDSEHILQLLRTLQESQPSRPLAEVLAELMTMVIGWTRSIDRNARPGLNLLVTNGLEMAGTRLNRPLHFVARRGVHDCEICGFPHIHHSERHRYRALVVASERISHEKWQEVPNGSVYRVNRDFRLEDRPLAEIAGTALP
ncbi:class II glutamine amidotransferase [Altererythrobacter luteolus]|uniref:Class II glutamine amidotransferase n=1 Tax=Pontixanthobacter luteolus TaxID=295089 RepID=A0A6I4V291_9SPHN|nr:class II glutamine amidotransferase [Pontixanthobacter luteolus]MXP48287.1 class II glutamine amidotransferase [Pontixanthobacter luteolus]